MKTRNSWQWILGLALAAAPLVTGCVQNSASADTAPAAATNAAVPQPAPGPASFGTNGVPPAELANDISQAPAKAITTEPAAPAALQANRPVMDVVKLANSGVDESVMLTFITNSASAFNIGADDIIYLKDIGVPDTVVKAMLHRDQDLKAQGAAVAAAPAGPTYQWQQPADTNTAPQPAPAPSQVAPQYEGTPAAPQPAPTAPTSVTYSTFYDSLSPYGTWIEIEGYGRVWQPTVVVVNHSWQPYFDSGRWVYSDQGWYWLSDYSWGWAPFHYGRWFRHNHYGWCWAPDLVWGPSWVTWRYNDAYCGWAPLPPAACYYPGYGFYYYGSPVSIGFGWGLGYSSWCFVSYSHFQHHGLHAYRVSDQHARPLYDNTVPVNRIVAQNNVVVNRGIPPEQIRAVTRQEVRRVSLQDTQPRGNAPRERLTASGRSLEVYRPTAQVRDDDPGIVQRSRREIPRNGANRGALSAAPAPSAPLAERSGMSRPAPNSSATGTRGNTLAETAPVPRSQIGSTVGTVPTRTEQPSKPRIEPAKPVAPIPQASESKPQAKPRLEAPARQADRPRTGEPIVLRGPQTSRPQSVDRAPATPTITRPERPSTPSRSEAVSPARGSSPTFEPRVETRPQSAAPATTWQRNESPRTVTPAPAPTTTRTVPQAPQQRWSTPAPAVQRAPAPTYSAPAPAPRVYQAPRYEAPSRPMEVPRAAPAPSYQAPSRPVEVPRSAPAPQPSYSAPRSAPPSAPASRGDNGSSRGNSRGDR